MKLIIITFVLVGTCCGDVSHISPEYSTTMSPAVPYNVQYGAERFPGHINRAYQEISDGSGTVYGSYSSVDPTNNVRTVEYVADQSGFHPLLEINQETQSQSTDSEAVRSAKEKHHQIYKSLANRNSRGSGYYPQGSGYYTQGSGYYPQGSGSYSQGSGYYSQGPGYHSQDIANFANAREDHLRLYDSIAGEHERVAVHGDRARDNANQRFNRIANQHASLGDQGETGRQQHLQLYRKIAGEHADIGAQRQAEHSNNGCNYCGK